MRSTRSPTPRHHAHHGQPFAGSERDKRHPASTDDTNVTSGLTGGDTYSYELVGWTT